jgi:flagellar assembly factor FliW
MPTLKSKYFGELPYEPGSVYRFPSGLPGFERETEFVFLERPGMQPLMFMQSLSNPDLCFLVLPILAIDSQYRLSLTAEDLSELNLPPSRQPQIGRDVLCGAIICVGPDRSSHPTANLLAPVVLNIKDRIGMQVIQTQSGYSHRHEFLPAEEVVPCS